MTTDIVLILIDPKSCEDYQKKYGYRHDGEYFLYLNWPKCKNGAVVYCSMMSSNAPLEYITLPVGVEKNFAGGWSKEKGIETKTYFYKVLFRF